MPRRTFIVPCPSHCLLYARFWCLMNDKLAASSNLVHGLRWEQQSDLRSSPVFTLTYFRAARNPGMTPKSKLDWAPHGQSWPYQRYLPSPGKFSSLVYESIQCSELLIKPCISGEWSSQRVKASPESIEQDSGSLLLLGSQVEIYRPSLIQVLYLISSAYMLR